MSAQNSTLYSTLTMAEILYTQGKRWAIRLEKTTDGSSKFWEASCAGNTGCTISWGRIGTVGQCQYGQTEVLKRAREKMKKGYREVLVGSTEIQPGHTKATPQELVNRATWRPIDPGGFMKMFGTTPPVKLDLPDIEPTLSGKSVHLYLAANGALWGLSPQENNEFVFARLRAP